MAEIIVALDMPGASEALTLLDRLPAARWVKVGSILFTREGPALVAELRRRGLKVFLDLKWHDIPNTVAGSVAAAREMGVALATVHTLGGLPMMRAAQKAAGGALALAGVTVLTSHDDASFGQVVGRPGASAADEVLRLTDSAREAGLAGVVCSPREARLVRDRLAPGAWIVVPGIRGPDAASDDQRRTASAAEAVRDGATHLVVGRPVTASPDPAGALAELSRAAESGPGDVE
jgi:orotidine-5'-phosphate decarboxylase